jgi:hypothetical protein
MSCPICHNQGWIDVMTRPPDPQTAELRRCPRGCDDHDEPKRRVRLSRDQAAQVRSLVEDSGMSRKEARELVLSGFAVL